MIAFFPSIYKDELLSNVLARYHNRSGNITLKSTTEELFGKNKAFIIPDFPTDLEELYENISYFSEMNVDDWINKHTLYHYYTNFNTKETKQIIRDMMLICKGKNLLHYITGQMASTVKEPVYYRFCPRCLSKDMEEYGETYWRTYQQLPSVYVCLEHNMILEDSSVLFRQENSFITHSTVLKDMISKDIIQYDFSKINKHLLYIFSQESYKLTIADYNFDQINLLEIYQYLLQEKGYMKSQKSIDQKRLVEDFVGMFGVDFLNLMQSLPSEDNNDCWLKSITRKHRKSFHPVRHLLFIHFLDESIDTIYQYANKSYNPFGEKPYLCLNPAAQHYLKPVITNLKITRCYDTKRPVGIFYCSCGFVYSRRGPDKTPEDKEKVGRIKELGDIWNNKLIHLIQVEKLSYRACAKILKVDTKTIIKYALKTQQQNVTENKVDYSQHDFKSQWLDLVLKNPTFSKTELRKKNPSLYMKLYRADKEWLNQHSPISLRKKSINKRVDWSERDVETLKDVKNAWKELSSRDKPVRITLSSIAKAINQQSLLEQKADKLPLTKDFINTVTESVLDFQKRRIEWSVDQLKDEELTIWKIRRKAGIRDYFYQELEGEMNSYL